MGDESLGRGRSAYAERAWLRCAQLLGAADEAEPLAAEDLERLGVALYMAGRGDACADVLERAHRLAVDHERWAEAARTAFWAAFTLFNSGEPARGGAWLARCRATVADRELGEPEATLPTLLDAHHLIESGRVEEAVALASAATEVGRRYREPDIEVLGRLVVAWGLLRCGRRGDAMSCFDEVMLTVSSEQMHPPVAGIAYCALVSACLSVLDVPRAREWTGVLSDWCDSQSDLVPYRGQCLIHRSQLRTMQGDWVAALGEAETACARHDGPVLGDAWYQLAEVRRLQGEHAAAEDAFRKANSLGRQPEPGLALLRLAQGRVDDAVTTFRRLYAEPGRVDRPDILCGYVEAMLAAGDLDAAQAGADELADASDGQSLVHRARADQAAAAVLLARDDPAGAMAGLRRALEVWTRLDMPYDAARVRVRIGDACRALGDSESALLEYDAARETFDRIGARLDSRRLGERAEPAGPLTAREVEVLRLVATGLTNRRIADDLVLSEKTVARHLSNIYAKLGIGSRAAATAYAYDHHLV